MWQQSAGAPPGTIPTIISLLPRPAVPSVLSVHDRQVYVDNIEAPSPGYVLARRWMRNDPDVDVESISSQPNALVLPRPLPLEGPAAEAPVFPDDSEDYHPEEAVRALKRHWVNVRKHDTEQRKKRLGRYRDRLKALTSPSMNPVNAAVTQLLTAQQQPAQLLAAQQQQQQQAVQALAASQPAALQAAHAQQQPGAAEAAPGQPQVAVPAALAGQQQQQQPAAGAAALQPVTATAAVLPQPQQLLAAAEAAAAPMAELPEEQQHTAALACPAFYVTQQSL